MENDEEKRAVSAYHAHINHIQITNMVYNIKLISFGGRLMIVLVFYFD